MPISDKLQWAVDHCYFHLSLKPVLNLADTDIFIFFSPLSHTVLLMLGVRGQPCGTQGPAFVRRPSTRAHHTDTTTTATPQQHHTTFLVWCHITRKVVLHGCGVVVVCLWCRCGVPGLCTKVRPCVPLYQPHLTPASYAGNYSLVAPQDAMDDCHFCLRCFK